MNASPESVGARVVDRTWAWRAGLFFLVATLFTLVAVPLLVQRRVNMLREQLEAAEPARTLLASLQFSLVRQRTSLLNLELDRLPADYRIYAERRATERQAHTELAPLVRRLGPEVMARFAELSAELDRWRADLPDERVLQPGDPVTAPTDRAQFEELLGRATALDSAILQRTAETRERIYAAERRGLVLTGLLGVLALLGSLAAAALYARMRRFATESERRRDEVERALSDLARANEVRAQLLRGLTHDVKNPLGAAKGYAELLSMGVKGQLTEAQAQLVDSMQRSVDSALAIIADLLDLSRADSGAVSVERVPVTLNDVAEEAVREHRPAADAAGHTLELVTDPAGVRVHTDPSRVQQVLTNLLSNAVKYTPPPGRITVLVEGEAGGNGDRPRSGRWTAIRVSDTGPGIPPDQRDIIFDEFTRLDEHAGVKGHGLGLAISRRLARILGGDLTVGDAPGGGATFTLWLPRRSGGDAAAVDAPARG